jgi:hypothetical protein
MKGSEKLLWCGMNLQPSRAQRKSEKGHEQAIARLQKNQDDLHPVYKGHYEDV